MPKHAREVAGGKSCRYCNKSTEGVHSTGREKLVVSLWKEVICVQAGRSEDGIC
ncbi:hypothetical protein [Dorea sp.]